MTELAIAMIISFLLNYECLIKQVLIEAEAESLAGKTMVAEVIRERSRRSGLGYCDVIDQPMQFGHRKIDPPAHAVLASILALVSEPACSAVHFDVASSRHGWARKLPVACVVDGHVFYENERWGIRAQRQY